MEGLEGGIHGWGKGDKDQKIVGVHEGPVSMHGVFVRNTKRHLLWVETAPLSVLYLMRVEGC